MGIKPGPKHAGTVTEQAFAESDDCVVDRLQLRVRRRRPEPHVEALPSPPRVASLQSRRWLLPRRRGSAPPQSAPARHGAMGGGCRLQGGLQTGAPMLVAIPKSSRPRAAPLLQPGRPLAFSLGYGLLQRKGWANAGHICRRWCRKVGEEEVCWAPHGGPGQPGRS